jgi:hypothetical protein
MKEVRTWGKLLLQVGDRDIWRFTEIQGVMVYWRRDLSGSHVRI